MAVTGEARWGARFVRHGFGVTADDDLAFALGWPHLIVLGRRRPKDVEVAIERLYHSAPPREIPRSVSARFARVLDCAAIGQGPPKVSSKRLGIAEATHIADARMQRAYPGVKDHELFKLLEAIVGADAIARAVVAGLERYGKDEASGWNRSAIHALRWLGMGLLRCERALGDELVRRLEALGERWTSLGVDPRAQLALLLDLVLHGGAGARRSGHRFKDLVSTFDLVFAHDDPDFVATTFEKTTIDSLWVPNVRLAFLGGDRVLDVVAKNWRKIRDGDDLRQVVMDFARIRSPIVDAMLDEIANASSVAGSTARACREARGT